MTKCKKIAAILMSYTVLIASGVLPQKDVAAESVTDYGISNPRIVDGVTTWDKIKFGSYYQDAEVQPVEPIKWRVLSVDGDDVFLLADKILDCKSYGNGTWETCTLRKWLNEDFYNEAFDAEEKKAISDTTVINENNPYYHTEGGNDTKDKVYLLSIAEASDVAYGFDKEFRKSSKTREAKNTDYAKVNNVSSDGIDCNGYWLLRSPAGNIHSDSFVSYGGYGYDYGLDDDVYYNKDGVRPALHINLSSSKVKDAGEIDSEGNITLLDNGINNPTVKDGVTTWDCIYFGNYRQNCKFKKQVLEWRVLSVDRDDAFLLADKNLDCRRYNEKHEDVTWETCTLRKWLNGEFYNEAFDANEKKAINEAMVVNDDKLYCDTEGGSDIKDKVYLLSKAEACSGAALGFDAKNWKTRVSKNTDYAKVNGAYSSYAGNGYWWLRSLGDNSNSAAFVSDDGDGTYYGSHVDNNGIGVRPALHINLSSSSWSKAGQINSNGEVTESIESSKPTSEPVETDNATIPVESTQATSVTLQPTLSSAATYSPASMEAPTLKQLKLSSVKCVKNTKKITGKVSVSKAVVKIKVGKKAYKKAALKGKKFTLRLNYKLKKNTKITLKVEKKGYKSLVKSYTAK